VKSEELSDAMGWLRPSPHERVEQGRCPAKAAVQCGAVQCLYAHMLCVARAIFPFDLRRFKTAVTSA
jgi:hypothetical protein